MFFIFRARIFFVGEMLNPADTPQVADIDDQIFMDFVRKKIKNRKILSNSETPIIPKNTFFGIFMSNVEPLRMYKTYKKVKIFCFF